MGLKDLQSHLLGIPDAVKSVDLLRLAKEADGNKTSFKLVVDGECCLDRLYGGYFPDWVCGGQWNKMEQFLSNFGCVLNGSPGEFVIFLNGSLEPERMMEDWCKSQEQSYKFLQEIQRHVTHKKKPPPKIWWIPPAFLRSALRLAAKDFHLKIMCSTEDHHKDLLRYARRNGCDGILADDAEYLLFDTPRYFSAKNLKLTFKGSLETTEMNMSKVFESLNLPKDRFLLFAAVMSNHILPEDDLKPFYTSLGVQNIQSKESVIEKVAEFLRGLESVKADKVADAIIAKIQPTMEEAASGELRAKIIKCLNYYSALGKPQRFHATRGRQPSEKKNNKTEAETKSEIEEPAEEESTINKETSALPSDGEGLENVTNIFGEGDSPATVTNGEEGTEESVEKPIPIGSDESEPAVTVKDETKESNVSSLDKLLYRVSYSIESIATNRHKNGIMSPYICQILRYREVRLPLFVQDIKNLAELPRAHELFRPLRQRVYAILFNLHHIHFLAKKKAEKEPLIFVKESLYDPVLKTIKTVGVPAVQIGWAVPTVEKLWLGNGEEAKGKRIRAFLTCLKSEKQAILDQTVIPQHLLILCCVLRYIVSSEMRVLRKLELDAFIAQALILELTDANVAQDIEVTNLTMRGVHLSHLFMEGIEMTLLVNDACGSPVPSHLFSPWYFFNGKIFNFVLEQMNLGKGLEEICGYKMNLVFNVTQLRGIILDGVKPQFAPPALNSFFLQTGPLLPGMDLRIRGATQSVARNSYEQRAGNMNSISGSGGFRGRPFAGSLAFSGGGPIPSPHGGFQLPTFGSRYNQPMGNNVGQGGRAPRGGQLQVAGTVVGSWGASVGNSRMGNNVGLVQRNPLFPIPFEHPVNSMMSQLRISSGNKVPNSRNLPQTGAQWTIRKRDNQTKNFHQKKKSIMKKSNGGSAGASTATNGSEVPASSLSKARGVSFKDDTSIEKGLRNEDGSGEAITSSLEERLLPKDAVPSSAGFIESSQIRQLQN